MHNARRSPSPRWLPALLALGLLTACGKPADESTASPGPAAAASTADQAAADAKDRAESTAKCEGNPLVKVMPPKSAIGDMPFEMWDCTFNSIRAVYGKDGGKEVSITLTDTRSPGMDKEPAMKDLYLRSSELQRTTVQGATELLVATAGRAKSDPATVEGLGGPDYVPIVQSTPSGDPLVIDAGAKINPGPALAMAVVKDRYVLSVQASDQDGAITGISGAQALAMYEPFLKQLHLDQLH